jgi:hypothetical protein
MSRPRRRSPLPATPEVSAARQLEEPALFFAALLDDFGEPFDCFFPAPDLAAERPAAIFEADFDFAGPVVVPEADRDADPPDPRTPDPPARRAIRRSPAEATVCPALMAISGARSATFLAT